MARQWGMGEPLYKCKRCGREMFARGSSLPIHRHKGKRVRCDASGSSITEHRRVTNPKK